MTGRTVTRRRAGAEVRVRVQRWATQEMRSRAPRVRRTEPRVDPGAVRVVVEVPAVVELPAVVEAVVALARLPSIPAG